MYLTRLLTLLLPIWLCIAFKVAFEACVFFYADHRNGLASGQWLGRMSCQLWDYLPCPGSSCTT